VFFEGEFWRNYDSFLELFPAIRLYLFLAKGARKRIPLLSGLGVLGFLWISVKLLK